MKIERQNRMRPRVLERGCRALKWEDASAAAVSQLELDWFGRVRGQYIIFYTCNSRAFGKPSLDPN